MITGLLLAFFSSIIGFFIALLPDSTGIPSQIGDSLATIVSYMFGFSWFFPMQTLFSVAVVALIFQAGLFGFWSIDWVIGKIRGGRS